MKKSEKIPNVKIPYPTEGVIRTASIDDTVSPANSVQSAVNLNFDQIGAVKTRLGLTKYADDVTGEVVSFGKLDAFIGEDGFKNLFKVGTSTQFSTDAGDMSANRIDDTHAIVFWEGENGDGFTQVVEIDLNTGVTTALNTPLEFDVQDSDYNSSLQVDATHFINTWVGTADNGLAQIFSVSTVTWIITAEGAPFAFDTSTDAAHLSLAKIDANHFLLAGTGSLNHGFLRVLEVNLGTWAVTQPAAALDFDTSATKSNSLSSLGDGEYFVNFWSSTGNGSRTQSFSVNNTTWVITAVGAAFNFDPGASDSDSLSSSPFSDGEHVIAFWRGNLGHGYARVFNVDPTTHLVTTAGPVNNFYTATNLFNKSLAFNDGTSFINTWRGANSDAFTQIFSVDISTYTITALSKPLNYGKIDFSSSPVLITDYKVFIAYEMDGGAGDGVLFKTVGDYLPVKKLYVQQQNGDILNTDSMTWTSVRTGLKTGGKARFAQFLNYLWMVNGNSTIGDTVQTSNGGAFGTDLVPDNFPSGDFIQAGFEGRVWVMDKLFDVLYFTDIVQFTPPDFYELTYNPDENFVKNFSPQNGQTATALVTTPRALLLFKQDSIYRIYGAYNVDAYPAYNVGTYSEESIVQTKDGLFFHHSSGFYQFNYGGEPIEISRRVIDFVEAIPRTYYENVEAVYDGADAVKWAIGPVTVEDVFYSNCVMRYTISTQVWTIYNYPNNDIRAFISYDDGTAMNILMGTKDGKVNKMDNGFEDLGKSISFEMIDRWRSFSEMYAEVKSLNGINVYSDNGAGVSIQYQSKKEGADTWDDLGELTEESNSLLPSVNTEESNVCRLRLVGVTSGNPIIIHGIEILEVDVRGYNEN